MQDRLNQILATRRALLQLLYRRSSIALAVGIHVAAVLFLFLGPVLFAERKQEWEYVDVQVVPASALPQPTPRTAATDPPRRDPEPTPPEPEPVPVETDPQPEPDRPQLPAEVPEETPDPEPPEPTPPQPEPDTQPPAEPTTEPPETAGPATGEPGDPSPDPTPGTGPADAPRTIAEVGPAGVIGFDDASFTYSYYVDRMLAAIAAQWTRPPVGRDIELIVHFVITSNGTVDQLEIITPSGIRAFDRAGERAVLSASPLPPLPRSYRKDSLGVTLIIQ